MFLLQYRCQIDAFDQAESNSALFLLSLSNTINQLRLGFGFLLFFLPNTSLSASKFRLGSRFCQRGIFMVWVGWTHRAWDRGQSREERKLPVWRPPGSQRGRLFGELESKDLSQRVKRTHGV